MPCERKANPEVIAALRKRFRDLREDEDLTVLDMGRHGYRYAVMFSTKRRMSCHLTLPAKLSNCRTVGPL